MNLENYIAEQIAFSIETFGPGRRTGSLTDHIKKELVEIEAAPHAGEEWIDVAMLAFDGAWRVGWTPEQICQGLQVKLAMNKARQWPDWRTAPDGQAIEHVRDA